MPETNFDPKQKLRGADKLSRIPIKIEPSTPPRKPAWLRIKLQSDASQINRVKNMLREKKLYSVCEEASCPNLAECFAGGTATFMIAGDICTRRCAFCDVAHGRPKPLDLNEPVNLAQVVADMQLKYVVITSVDRDDLRDGGASHFAHCIEQVRLHNPGIKIEILVPDFRGRMEVALEHLAYHPPDVFNHNLETVPRLYKQIRPGSDYHWSLKLLEKHKQNFPNIPTKSGLMLGLGETNEELIEVFKDLRQHQVDMLTLGQYLQPSKFHAPIMRYVSPEEFDTLGEIARNLGFTHVASGPLVRSSYHADRQASGETVK